jgi:surface polysaccharide O-acyltransferase-like enzyme
MCAGGDAKAAKRDSGLDLLRIACTMMVVCNHLMSWTGILDGSAKPLEPLWLAENTLFALTLPAVNCFVLISGFFLCNSKFKLKKLVCLWTQALFYSVGFYLLACVFDKDTAFSTLAFLKSFLVVILRRYWFVTAYVLLYIFSPYLNCAIHAMNQ